ncbi:MAG TPA: FAD-dependent oxidoreductase [Oscillospiraceae bacterium]|nr:FAD-dependent oxidoreductase [Oscillospiraceae bacterium]
MTKVTAFEQPPHPYWLASSPQTNYPRLEEDVTVDAAIIGGGITGITCAYLLKKAGLTVAVVEADHLAQGATGHTTAKISSQHGLIYQKIKQQMGQAAAQQYAEANETAIRQFEKIIKEEEIACDFSPQAAYVYTERDGYREKIEAEAELASKLGIEATVAETIALPFPVKAALRFAKQAQFHPRKFLLPLAESVPGNGSYIFEQSRIVGIDNDHNYLLKTADGNRIHAEKVIIATHYPCYNKSGFYFTRIYQGRSYVVAVKAQQPYPGGMYITAEEPGRSFRSLPTAEGELIMVGGEHHKAGQGADTREHYQALAQSAGEIFPQSAICCRWSTQDCITLDGLPYIGQFLPSTPNLYLATGYQRWGMTNSMVAAMLLRDLITKGESPWQDVYNPSRLTLAASAKPFVTVNLNVANQLIKGKLATAPTEVELKPGEAKVMMVNDDKVGAYRDQQGTLHLVDTSCTHLGCELQWNAAELSWDCPCHGSRFTYKGEIIEGPAIKALKAGQEHRINRKEKSLT